MSQAIKKRVPRAKPEPWHQKSIAEWDSHSERMKVGRAERKKIRERWENRFQK
jgi:hypothetical protein